MIKLVRFLVVSACSVALASSIGWSQTYTSVDYPGATFTALVGGPNPQGTSVGQYEIGNGIVHGFTYTANGVFTTIDPPGSAGTSPNFIDPEGTIVGSYFDAGGVEHGFILSGGIYKTVDYPGAAGTALSSINPSGEIVGSYCQTVALCFANTTTAPFVLPTFNSFTLSKGGVFSKGFNPPGATSGSLPVAVLPSGAIVGDFSTSGAGTCNTECAGYLFYMGKYATISFPGSTFGFTFAGGANAEGDVVGFYDDNSGNGHGFLFNGTYSSFDFPGAVFTEATGINPSGVIVGEWADSSNNAHGFVRTP